MRIVRGGRFREAALWNAAFHSFCDLGLYLSWFGHRGPAEFKRPDGRLTDAGRKAIERECETEEHGHSSAAAEPLGTQLAKALRAASNKPAD